MSEKDYTKTSLPKPEPMKPLVFGEGRKPKTEGGTDYSQSKQGYDRRVEREFKRFADTGRVSNFLQAAASKDKVLATAINAVRTSGHSKVPTITSFTLGDPLPVDSIPKKYHGPRGSDETPLPTPQPFELRVAQVDGSTKIRVYASTLAGGSSADLGFTDGSRLFNPSTGILQGKITINGETGAITARALEMVSSLSEDTDDTFYVEIGTVTQDQNDRWIVSNSTYGPIAASVCRLWFAVEEPFYEVNFIPSAFQ